MKVYKGSFDWLVEGVKVDWYKPVVIWCDEELKIEEERSIIKEIGSFKFLIEYDKGKDCYLFLCLNENDYLNGGEGYDLIRKRMYEGKENYQILIKEGGFISVLRFPVKGYKKIWQCCKFNNELGILRLLWFPCVFSEEFFNDWKVLKAERL